MSLANHSTEEVRNRLLRRVDWRFVLSNPSPAQTVCWAAGDLATAAGLISRCVPPEEAVAGGNCELAIAVDPDADTLRAAWAALRAGGECYAEWTRAAAGGIPAIRQRMMKAGFQPVYWFSPWPRSRSHLPLVWVQLQAREPLRNFVVSAISRRSIRARLSERLNRIGWIIRTWLGVGSPVCVLARKAEKQPSRNDLTPPPEQPNNLLDEIRRRWDEWGLGAPGPRLSWLLLSGGARSTNKVVRLVFSESARPRLVIKTARVPEADAGLAHEATMLRQLQRGAELPGVPKLLLEDFRAGHLSLVETALNGVPLPSRLSRKTYRALALLGTDWLVRFAGSTQPLAPTARPDRRVEMTVRGFEAMFGRVIDPSLLRESSAVLETLRPQPVIWEQRDFSPWNLLLGPDHRLQVLDWESAEPQGLPFVDLTYYTSYLAFYLQGIRTSECWRNCYREILRPATFVGAVSQECQERYAEGLGISLESAVALRLLCWMLHSRSEYQRFVADAGGVPAPAQLRRSVFVSLWEEELHSLLRSGLVGLSGHGSGTDFGFPEQRSQSTPHPADVLASPPD